MARGRKRKSDRGSFTKEQMKSAVNDVIENNVSLRNAAEQYNLKFQTFARYVTKQKNAVGEEIRMTPKYASRNIFSEAQELALKDYIIQCSKMCYGQTMFNVRTLAYEMAMVNGLNVPDSWKRDKNAGLEWLHGFFKRHPDIAVRRPENCSLSRMTAFNENNVKIFFDNLRRILQR